MPAGPGAPVKFDAAVKQYFIVARKAGLDITNTVRAYNDDPELPGTLHRDTYYMHRALDTDFADAMESAKEFSKKSRAEQMQDLADEIMFAARTKTLEVILAANVPHLASKMTPTELGKFAQLLADAGVRVNLDQSTTTNTQINQQNNAIQFVEVTADPQATLDEVDQLALEMRRNADSKDAADTAK